MPVDMIEYARQLAEQGRNYNAAFEGAGQYGAPGTSGGEGGAGYAYDPNAPLPAVGWSGPAAYNVVPVGTQFTPGNEAAMYAALASAKQFDPNATLTPQMGTTGEGGSIDQQQYVLNYDPSKVPQPVHPNLAPVGRYGSNESVWDENMLYNDPNYGPMTYPQNMRGSGGWDWLGTVGPLAVSAFGFGIPALAAGMSAGALGGAAGSAAGMPWWGSTGLNAAQQLGSGHFDPLSLAGSAAPGVIGMLNTPVPVDNWGAAAMGDPTAYGLPAGDNWDPSVMGNTARYGLPTNTEVNWGNVATGAGRGLGAYGMYQSYAQSQQQPKPQPTQSEITTYNPQNFGKLNQSMVNTDNQPVATTYTGDMPYTFGKNRGY
jgi:hypothetical protein